MGLLKGARPSPAIVVAILALVAGVTGAAVAQPAAKKAVTKKKAKKIADKEIEKLAPGLSVASAASATNATNATNAARAQTFDADATLASGETLTGVWTARGGFTGSPSSSNNLGQAIEFMPRLPGSLGQNAAHRITPGNTTTQCPGQDRAAPGQLCVYERASASITFNAISNPVTGLNGADRRGAIIGYTGNGASAVATGTWAVTAP